MARHSRHDPFEAPRFENLEPRLLLSGHPLTGGPRLAATPPEPLLHVEGTREFDGQDDVLAFDAPAELNTNTYTIAFWLKSDAPTAGTQALVARGEDWANDKAQWVVELNDRISPGTVQLWYEQANDRDHYFPAQTAIEPGTWYHLAVTRTPAGEVAVYVDGEIELSVTDPQAPAAVDTPVTLGARRNSPDQTQDYFDGALHEVLIYDVVLDAEAIGEVLDETRPGCWAGDRLDVSELGQNADVVMAPDGGFLVVWQMPDGSDDGIFARRYDAAGEALGGAFQVNTYVDGPQREPAVAMAGEGSAVVVWSSWQQDGDGEGVFARRYDAAGEAVGGEFQVSAVSAGEQGWADVAMDAEGNFVVVYGGEDVFAQRFDAAGGRVGPAIRVNDEPQEYRGDPEVAMNADGQFVVSYLTGEWVRSAFATYDAEGHRLAAREVDSDYHTGVGINDDGFVVYAWCDYYEGLLAQVYTLYGTEVGETVLVTPGKHGGLDYLLYDADVAMTETSFVVTWRDYDFPEEGSGHGNGVYAARFDMAGRRVGEEIEVGQYGSYDLNPSIAVGGGGRFVVAWQEMWGEGIYARPYHCTPVGSIADPLSLLHVAGQQDFDGQDDYLRFDDDELNTNVYTIALWLRADYPGETVQSLIARGEDDDDKAQWIVQLNAEESPGRIQLWYEDAGGGDSVFATTTSIAPERWYHFAATRSADGLVEIYLDGVLESAAVDPRVPVSTDTPVLVAARHNAPGVVQDFFDGRLAEVAVFDGPMSPYQLNRLLLETRPQEQQGPVYSHPGLIELDGAGDYVQVSDIPALNTRTYTIAFSFQADAPTARTQALVARGEDWAHDKAQWVVELNDPTNPGKLQLWYEEPDDGDHYFAAAPTIAAGEWHHVVVARSPEGRVAIYLDGQLEHESVDPAPPASVATPVTIGARRNSPNKVQDFFDGRIEGLEIYNVALSHDEIVDIVPAPRLVVDSPIDGGVYETGEIDLAVSFDRALTDLSYSLNGAEAVSLMQPNWVYQETPDATSVWSHSAGRVTFEYLKPEWAVAARWQYRYATADGTFTFIDDIPQDAWDYYADRVACRVQYTSDHQAYAQANGGGWETLRFLGENNPGGSGDDSSVLHDGNWSTGAAYHGGAEQWLTSCSGTYVKFLEEAILWDVRLVEDAVSTTITAGQGENTLTVTGTDTLGKTTSVTVEFTVL